MSDLPPAGWYPDPTDPGGTRYWDGTQWTSHVGPSHGSAPGAGPYGGGLPSSYGPGGGPGRGLPDVGDYLGACFSTAFRAIGALLPQVLAILAAVVLLGGALLASSDVDDWLDEVVNDVDTVFEEDEFGNVEYVGPDWPGFAASEVSLAIVLGVVVLLGSAWLAVASIFVLVDLAAGRDPRVPRAGEVVTAFGRLVALGLLALVAMVAAVVVIAVVGAAVEPILAVLLGLALVPVGIWLGIRLSLSFAIATVEGGIGSAIAASFARTRGHFWALVGRFLLYGLLLSIASQIVSTAVGVGVSTGLSGAFAVSILLSFVIQTLSSIFNAAATTVAHVALVPEEATPSPTAPGGTWT